MPLLLLRPPLSRPEEEQKQHSLLSPSGGVLVLRPPVSRPTGEREEHTSPKKRGTNLHPAIVLLTEKSPPLGKPSRGPHGDCELSIADRKRPQQTPHKEASTLYSLFFFPLFIPHLTSVLPRHPHNTCPFVLEQSCVGPPRPTSLPHHPTPSPPPPSAAFLVTALSPKSKGHAGWGALQKGSVGDIKGLIIGGSTAPENLSATSAMPHSPPPTAG